MLKAKRRRLIVNLNDLRHVNQTIAVGLLREPLQWLPPLEAALREVASHLNDPSYEFDLSITTLHAGIEGSFGSLHTTPRSLSSKLLSHMVCLDGIITSCSLVRPKLLRSVHYSETSKTFKMREYYDATMIDAAGQVTAINYPTGGEEDPTLVSEHGLSNYRNYQTVSMQEMPERAPAGQIPCTIDIVLDDDLIDAVKPGDRVQIVGVFKSLSAGSIVPSHFRNVVIALAVRPLATDLSTSAISPDDLQNIKSLSRRRDIFDLLSRSLAPSIYGHAWVKRAILLMLLGGVEKTLSNGSHLRGDINLMLVGDPSTAKSQLLRYVLALAPLAIATTGKGSSGVGLTAAVTSDRETGERRLEAGAMVLADRGIVCIDEFDKMSDSDRVAIHEVMEQQTVTIAKAGIHVSLNARCSVLAAANPIWGQYRETASPQENIRLPDSLLSRFDLLFIILDTATPEHDLRISQHVLRMHRFIPTGLEEGQPIPESFWDVHASDGEDEEHTLDGATAVFQKHYGANREDIDGEGNGNDNNDDDDEIITLPFLKKYIQYARTRLAAPTLTKAAVDCIVNAYAEFRQQRDTDVTEAKTFPVTPRTLETLIRLATAHAKARLCARVEKKDALVAQEMVEYCLYKEVKKKPSKRQRRKTAVSDEEDDTEQEDSDADEETDNVYRSTNTITTRPVVDTSMEGLSLEEVATASILANKNDNDKSASGIDLALAETTTPSTLNPSANLLNVRDLSQPFISVDSQLADSLQFVDPSQETASFSITKPSETVINCVKAAINRLRNRSTSAVFSTTVEGVQEEIAAADAAMAASITTDLIMAVVEQMKTLNQAMISDNLIYII